MFSSTATQDFPPPGSRPLGAISEAALPPKGPSAAAMLAAGAKDPKSDQDFSFRRFLGNLVKGLGSGVTDVGQFISSLTPGKLAEYAQQFLKGGAGGPGGGAQLIPFTQDTSGSLFPVSGGPGPYVGGGVPSPSGGMGGGAPSPIQCPPGFKFDPVQNICVPIVAPAPPVTTTPAPGTTAPAPATGGISNIPNVYPFTLTPPIGAPIGNIAPVRS